MTDEEKMQIAIDAAESGLCRRRKIGAALFDVNGNLLATGHNGTPQALPSCLETPCAGSEVPAGTGGAVGCPGCFGVHAEIDALLSCDTSLVYECFSTKAPCPACTLALLATPCARVVFKMDSIDQTNKEIWQKTGKMWDQI